MIQFVELLRRLEASKLEFVVVGGVAATIHGISEPTRDLDVCIRLDAASWAKVHSVIAPLHPCNAMSPNRPPLHASAAELASYRNLYVQTDLGRVDFLGEVPPLGPIDALEVHTVEIAGMPIRVLGLEALIRVKEHVRRPKDLEVATQLRAIRDAARKKPAT